jgi:hypothetical protein
MVVEWDDKRPDPRTEEIQRDWLSWATRNGYVQIESLSIAYEDAKIAVEIWENPAQEDRYLIYLPPLPHAAGDGGEKLFLTRQERIAFMRDSVTKIASVALILATEKWKVRQDQKMQLN